MSGEFIDMRRKFLGTAGRCCTWVALCNRRPASQVMLLVLGIAGPEGRIRTLPKVRPGPMKRIGPHLRTLTGWTGSATARAAPSAKGSARCARTACSGTNQNGS